MGTAVALWDLVEQAIPVETVVEELATRFRERVELIEPDVRAALDEMRELGVIDIADTA